MKKVKFVPAYSGGKIFSEGITIPEVMEMDGEMFLPGVSKLPQVVDLDEVILEQNVPILYTHKPMCRLGHTTRVERVGNEIHAEGFLSSPSEWTREIVESFQVGARWQVSIGAGLIETEQKEIVKETRTVNGQTLSPPFLLLHNVRIREISIVPVGADPSTEVLLASLVGGNLMTFDDFCAAKGFDVATLDDANRTALEALFVALNPPEGSATTTPTQTGEGGENDKKDEPLEASEGNEGGENDKKDEQLKASEGNGGEKKDETLEASSGRRPTFQSLNTPDMTGGNSNSQIPQPKRSEVLQASALMSMNIPGEWLVKNGVNRRAVDIASSGSCDGSMLSMMGEALQASGLKPDYRNPHGIVRDYKELLTASGISSKNFGDINVFSPIIDKQMRYKYEQLAPIWEKLYKKRVVRDFKDVATVDFDVKGKAEIIPENGDYPQVYLESSGEKFAVSKQGVSAGISFESQVNDDMGALDDVSNALLDIIVDTQIDMFWTLFWSKVSTNFTAAKGNRLTVPLSIDGLSTVLKAFKSRKNARGRFLNTPPKYLLVPTALEAKAESIYTWQWGEANASGNIHVGKYEVVTDPYLGTEGGYTGASDTGYFLLGDTHKYPLGEYAVMSGYESPSIKESWYDHKDGLNLRAMATLGFHAYSDKLAAVYSTGAGS